MNLTDEQLVESYKNGDSNAFNVLYLRYKDTVKYFARNLFLLGADFDDLIQEGMFGLIKAVNSYKSGESSFRTYATICIKTSLYSAVKKYSAFSFAPLNNSDSFEILDSLGLSSQTPEDFTLKKENGNEFYKKLNDKLSKTEMEVLKLYLQGLSYLEISKKLNKDSKFVDNALQRVRKKIIKFVGE